MSRGTILTLLLAFASCNATLQGDRAPALPAIGWIAPAGPEARIETRGRWVVVEFFSPT